MNPEFCLITVALLCTLLVALVWRCALLSRARHAAEQTCAAAREGEANVTRSLQLLAHELQSTALSLRGHADHLAFEAHDDAPKIAVVAAQLGGLADELSHHLIPTGLRRPLDCETVPIAELAAEAIDAITEAISPGRRHWRVSGDTQKAVTVWADRKSLRLVLVRVLGEAVRSSAHDDWIEIGWKVGPKGLTIRIEDEGAGTASSDAASPGVAGVLLESRGIGLRLSLARMLTQAHGGALEVEGLARIGTSVTIVMPIERLNPPTPLPPPLFRPDTAIGNIGLT